MTAEELDAAAYGTIPCMAVDPDLTRAVQECYLPMREAGYTVEQSRFAAAGYLGALWGMKRVEREAPVLRAACDTAEGRIDRRPA
jgi:hypothetical protein